MSQRRANLLFPILWAVLGIAFTTTILVAWNIILTQYFILTEESQAGELGVGFWFILAIGDLLMLLVVLIVVLFMVGSIKQVRWVRRQNTFIDSVTHELKSPLAGLRLGVDTLAKRELSPEMKDKFLTMMGSDIDRLQDFIEQLLEAGRLTHNERPIERQTFDLRDMLAGCIDKIALRYEIDSACIQLSVDGDDEVTSDPVALETVVMNLLSNAIKYSPGDKDIRVSVANHPKRLELNVIDTGIGISPKQLKSVFKRFHRIRHAAASVRGTGLGLYVVQELVERMGGTVTAHSEGDGTGSRFEVVLTTNH